MEFFEPFGSVGSSHHFWLFFKKFFCLLIPFSIFSYSLCFWVPIIHLLDSLILPHKLLMFCLFFHWVSLWTSSWLVSIIMYSDSQIFSSVVLNLFLSLFGVFSLYVLYLLLLAVYFFFKYLLFFSSSFLSFPLHFWTYL